MEFYPVILSGGAGSRLWPVSREFYPKPLLPIAGEKSLLQETAARLASLEGVNTPMFVCNEEHRFLVDEQVQIEGKENSLIMLEPRGRDTAPALTIAAIHLAEQDPDGVMVVMPADHVIPDAELFSSTVKKAGELANKGHIVTFGIVPDKPETGYGYIKRGNSISESKGFSVDKFVEKPDEKTAEEYLASGDYFWNGGIFVTRAQTWLDEIGKHRPIILAACKQALAENKVEGNYKRVNEEVFLSCPAESIDYAVMENTDRAAVLPMEASWSDVGSWSSIWEISDQDENGNVFKGDVISHATSNTLVMGKERCIATVGLDNIVVVETDDAILVADKNKSQDVKKIVGELKKNDRDEFRYHNKVHKPWGNFSGVKSGDGYQVKHVSVSPGKTIAMQKHLQRSEHWTIVAGSAKVTLGDKVINLSENESVFIPQESLHELHNPGTTLLEVIQVQTGTNLDLDGTEPEKEILENVS